MENQLNESTENSIVTWNGVGLTIESILENFAILNQSNPPRPIARKNSQPISRPSTSQIVTFTPPSICIAISLIFVSFLVYDFYLIVKEKSLAKQLEIDNCFRLYDENHCHPSERIPYIEESCRKWEECMLQSTNVKLIETFIIVVTNVFRAFIEAIGRLNLFLITALIMIVGIAFSKLTGKGKA